MKIPKKDVRKAAEAQKKAKAKKVAQSECDTAREKNLGESAVTNVVAGNAKPQVVNHCWFCLKKRQLCKSHIIPKFHDRKKSTFCMCTDWGKYGGIREDYSARLFCSECEGKFSRVESLYSKWWKMIGIDNAPIQMGKMHSVDQSGNWLVESCDSGTAITVKEADLNLLKKMLLINVFRMQCLFAFRWGDMGAKKHDTKIRKILVEILDISTSSLADDAVHLARFSIEATYVYIKVENVEGKSDLVVPAIAPYLGTVMATVHPTHPTKPSCFPCWIGPVFWDIVMGKELDIRSHADIRIECHTYENVLPSNILKAQKEYLLKR